MHFHRWQFENVHADELRLTGLKAKREAVELWLRTIVRLRKQQEIRRFRGVVTTSCIEKDLSMLYSDRDFDPFVQHLGLRSAN
jgi:Arc/MetJ family transcription regulator